MIRTGVLNNHENWIVLCEPAMRNTAPCIAYAAFKIQSINKKANMIVAASDHIILKDDDFLYNNFSFISLLFSCSFKHYKLKEELSHSKLCGIS